MAVDLLKRVQTTDAPTDLEIELAHTINALRSAEKGHSLMSDLYLTTRREKVSAMAALDTLKGTVGTVAMEYARKHDWCEEVRNALEEMGIPVPQRTYRARINVTYYMDVTTDRGDLDEYDVERAIDSAEIGMSLEDTTFEVYETEWDCVNVEASDD